MLFGTTLALADGAFDWGPFLAMLLASLLIQAATNMFNEFYDEKRGLDTADSVGIAGSIVGGRMHARAVGSGPAATPRWLRRVDRLSEPTAPARKMSRRVGGPGQAMTIGSVEAGR